MQPGAGPPIHVHWKQVESLTVISGRMATQELGKEIKYYNPGETASFKKGVWHRFWNPGKELLHIKGLIEPAHNLEFFLTELYKAFDKGKKDRPSAMEGAFLIRRYRSEFAVHGLPPFVKNVIMPVQFFIGKITGAHRQFKNAPAPVK